MPWVLLIAAIATEVASTLALRGSDGFSKLGPSIITIVGYVASFILLALALNTGAALPIYWSLAFGSGRRLDRLREAWSNYWALFRGLVIPACALFGVVVFRLLAGG